MTQSPDSGSGYGNMGCHLTEEEPELAPGVEQYLGVPPDTIWTIEANLLSDAGLFYIYSPQAQPLCVAQPEVEGVWKPPYHV